MTLQELCRELGLKEATVKSWNRTQRNWAKRGIYIERTKIKPKVYEYTITRKEVENNEDS